jgi:hypothetical protein
MMSDDERRSHLPVQPSLATHADGIAESELLPRRAEGQTEEVLFPDWQRRLRRNLSRRSDGRWDPLSYWR